MRRDLSLARSSGHREKSLTCSSIRNALVLTSTIILASVASAAHADTLPVIDANREVGLALSGYWLYYREYNKDNFIQDSEHGWIPGFSFKASVLSDEFGISNVFGSLTYRYNRGYSHHSSLPNSETSGSNTIDYSAGFTSNEIIGEVGKGILAAPNLLVTPVIELEYREWLRTIPQAGLAIQEDYTFFAPGTALRGTYALTSRLILTSKLGIEYTVSPTNATVGNGSAGVPNLTFSLGSRPLWQADFGADYAITHSIHAYVGAAYSHFGFSESPVAHFGTNGTEFEPTSVTDQVSVDVGLAWSF